MTATRQRDRVVRSQVDPKLVERRRAVAESDRARRRRTVILLGIVVAVIAAMVGALFSPLLDVDHIEVTGAERLTVEELLGASGLERGDRMVELDLAEARAALRALPGVRSAHLTREWPGTLRVVVAEEQPVAVVVSGGTRVVVSSTGRILEHDPAAAEGLVPVEVEAFEPVEDGRAVPEDVLAAALLVHRMAEPVRSQVAVARVARSGELSVELTDGATIRFGPVEDLPAKLGAAESVLTQVRPECREVIDVREPSRVTVSRRSGCQPPPVTDTTVATEQVEG